MQVCEQNERDNSAGNKGCCETMCGTDVQDILFNVQTPKKAIHVTLITLSYINWHTQGLINAIIKR